MPGYCEVDDVGDVLFEDFDGAIPSIGEVQSAIAGQTEATRRALERHYYDPTGTFAFAGPETVVGESCDIPDTPHAPASVVYIDEQQRYPQTFRGRYTRVALARRDVDSVTGLYVRDRTGAETDWATTRTQGRGEDYYVDTDPHTGRTHVYLDVGALPALYDYSGAVRVDYEYGVEGIPETIRRATALLAAAELAINDEFRAAIPDDGQLTNPQTKADQFESRAQTLLNEYDVTKVA